MLPFTVAVNGEGKERLCWNAGRLNDETVYRRFKMEHASTAAALMLPGDFMFVLDMKSGYHQIPLRQSFRRFC